MFANHNLNKIYLSEAIRSLGLGMIQIFIPIFLLSNGYSFEQVALFYIIASLTHITLAIPAGYLGSKIGYSYLILLSVPFFILFFLCLKTVPHLIIPLYTLAIVKELGNTLYWVGRHSFMGYYMEKGKTGTQLGINKIFSSLAGLPAPLIGGLILSLFGMKVLIPIVLAFLVVSVWPLSRIKEEWQDREFSIAKVFAPLHFKNAPIFMVQGMDNVVDSEFVWPVYLYFTILYKYVALGLASVLPSAASLIFNYVTGLFSDKNYKRTLHLGAIFNLGIWSLRIFGVRTPAQVYVVDSVSGITDNFIQIPFGSKSYEIAKESYFLQFIVFREIAIQAGKILALVLVLVIGSLTNTIWLGLLYPLGYLVFRFHEGPRFAGVAHE